jgi:hypothetical protein
MPIDPKTSYPKVMEMIAISNAKKRSEALAKAQAILDEFGPEYKVSYAKPPPRNPCQFTENERAFLLKSVIDALRSRPDAPAFNVWHRHGLSRIYFADDSWLSYGADGTPIFGPDKTGDAYRLRNELKLEKAKKEKLK